MDSMCFLGVEQRARLGDQLGVPFVLANVAFLLPAFVKFGFHLLQCVAALAWCVSKLAASTSLWLWAMLHVSHNTKETVLVLPHSGMCCPRNCPCCQHGVHRFSCLTPMANLVCILTALRGHLGTADAHLGPCQLDRENFSFSVIANQFK